MQQLSAGSTNPFVIPSANSPNPMVVQSLSQTSTKRKHGHGIQQTESLPKRRRLMGRPRNRWTTNRLRKLVRLYLMTNLDVIEISKVLRANEFEPCKRDVQKQLCFLIQSQPDKIRLRGNSTKARLGLLRECKILQTLGHPENNMGEDKAITDEVELVTTRDNLESKPSTSEDSKTPDIGLIKYSLEGFDFGCAMAIQDSDSLPGGEKVLTKPEDPPSISNLPLLGFDPSPIDSEFYPSSSGLILDPLVPNSQELDSPIVAINNSMSAENHIMEPSSEIPNTGSHIEDHSIVRKPRYTDSIVSTGEKSSHSSKLSINSLRRRLGFKYSESYLGDIISLIQHFTIAGSSIISSRRTERRSGKAFPGIFIHHSDARLPLPSDGKLPAFGDTVRKFKGEHSLILPGKFPTYCWKQINHNKLRPCHHGTGGRNLGPQCRPRSIQTYRTIHSDIFSRILDGTVRAVDINEVDTFGNSVLHIAAALAKPPRYLLALLDLRPNIHVLNNAGQTFLHLVDEGLSTDCLIDIRALLVRLQREGFNFLQRDHLGQTSLHLLTRPWIHESVLREIMEEVRLSGIVLPTSRDNLGRTVLEQLKVARTGNEFLRQWLFANPTPKFEGHTRDPEILHDPIFETKLKHVDGQCLPNYGGNTSIETWKDLQIYEQNADLLRTILKAYTDRGYEDHGGRNGLHCLAEVSLNLPIPEVLCSSKMESNIALLPNPRSRYLEDLLRAGVDPNSYDKRGITPIMAFIIYLPALDDDLTIIPILSRLLDAGADIHSPIGVAKRLYTLLLV